MPTVAQILASARRDTQLVTQLRHRLSHTHSTTTRRHLLRRIRRLEDHLNLLYAEFLKKGVPAAFTVFGSRKPKAIKGILVQVDISTDGLYFSNPAPKIGNKKNIWVRVRVDASNKAGEGEVANIPWLAHFLWVVPSGYTKRDTISTNGRNEYFVSLPLTVTREFMSPSSGSTKGNFGCYVDVYKPIDASSRQPTSGATPLAVLATWDPGTYPHYIVNTSTKRITSASSFTTGGFTAQVDNSETKFYRPATSTYYYLRRILTGLHAGLWVNIHRDGVTSEEVFLND